MQNQNRPQRPQSVPPTMPDFLRPDGSPTPHGLYDPSTERDNCGVGFVAHIKGERSRQIVDDADRILRHMVHRGACGCEPNTGDGAGMLTGMPDAFLRKVAKADADIDLPAEGQYGCGLFFLPTDDAQRAECKKIVEGIVARRST